MKTHLCSNLKLSSSYDLFVDDMLYCLHYYWHNCPKHFEIASSIISKDDVLLKLFPLSLDYVLKHSSRPFVNLIIIQHLAKV